MFKNVSTITILNQINEQSKVIDKIHSAVGERNTEFENKYIKPLKVLADWVKELPCSKVHHVEPGGAVRLAAHAGFVALRLSDAAIFTPSHLSEFRSKLEPQSRYATYLATVFSVLAYPLSNVDVICDGTVWDKTNGLSEFLIDKGDYSIEWTNASQLELKKGAFHGARLMPIELVCNLDPIVSAQLMSAIPTETMNITGQESIMQKIVKQAIQKAIDADKEHLLKQFSITTLVVGEVTEPQQKESTPTFSSGDTVSTLPESVKNDTTPQAVKQDSSVAGRNIMDALDPAVRDIFDMLIDDIKSDDAIKKKVHITESGMTVPSSVFSHYGLPLNTVEADLRKKGGLVKKDGQTFHISKQIGDWVITQLGDVFSD